MAVFTAAAAAIGAIGGFLGTAAGIGTAVTAATAVGGGVLQIKGQKQAAKAQQRVAAASQRAEKIRADATRADVKRQQRKVFRQARLDRATANANLINQGVEQGSSVIASSFGGLNTQQGQAIGALGSNLGFSLGIFGANAEIAGAQSDAFTGQAIAGFGQQLFNSAGTFGKVAGNLGGGGGNNSAQGSQKT